MLAWARQTLRSSNLLVLGTLGLIVAACTTSDVRTNTDGTSNPTSIPVAQVGGAGDDGSMTILPQPVNSGLLLVSSANLNLCVGVDKVAVGGNLIVRACDGNQATLWQLAGGQLRMGTTLCAQNANAAPNAASLTIGSGWVLADCDATVISQHIDTQINGGIGPTLAATTRYDIVTSSPPVIGTPVTTAQHAPIANANVTLTLAGTQNAEPTSGHGFAIRLANSSGACLGTKNMQPEIVACTGSNNQWWTTTSGQLLTSNNQCLAIDLQSGQMTLPPCSPNDVTQSINTYGTALMAGALVSRCASFQNVSLGANQVTWVECGYGAQPFSFGPVN